MFCRQTHFSPSHKQNKPSTFLFTYLGCTLNTNKWLHNNRYVGKEECISINVTWQTFIHLKVLWWREIHLNRWPVKLRIRKQLNRAAVIVSKTPPSLIDFHLIHTHTHVHSTSSSAKDWVPMSRWKRGRKYLSEITHYRKANQLHGPLSIFVLEVK